MWQEGLVMGTLFGIFLGRTVGALLDTSILNSVFIGLGCFIFVFAISTSNIYERASRNRS